MKVKVQTGIRRRPEIIGLPLRSFFILLLSLILLVLLILSSFTLLRCIVIIVLMVVEYGVLFYIKSRDTEFHNDLPNEILNG